MRITKSTILWYVVPILLFFAIVLLFFTKPIDLTKTTMNYSAGKLVSNTPLQLAAGEAYKYEYNISGQLANITYEVVGPAGSCMQVRATATGAEDSASTALCIGLLTGDLGQNPLAGDFFQPWMLSAAEGFSWSSTTRIVYPEPIELDDSSTHTVFVITTEAFRGRQAFRVRSTSVRTINGERSGSLESILWVDKQKRVLLGAESELFTISLISAPFPLSNVSSN